MFSLNQDKKDIESDSIMNNEDSKFLKKPNDNNNKNMKDNNQDDNTKSNSWNEDFSWSRILMSDSESLRRTGTVYRQKDTNMVSLVRRLELFPSLDLILSTRKLFDDEIVRLNKVKVVVEFESNQLKDSNPILTQASMEVESELAKIEIEKESFEKKLSSEVQIIDDLVQTIISHESKNPELISALVKIYNFDLDKENKVVHQSKNSNKTEKKNNFGTLKTPENQINNNNKQNNKK